jgi:malate dehydrogenase
VRERLEACLIQTVVCLYFLNQPNNSWTTAGSAYYAPSAAAVEMTESILKDKKKILPCAAYLEGEYGINGLYVGVPCKLGACGLEQIIEINLLAEERIALQKSAAAVQELVNVLGI